MLPIGTQLPDGLILVHEYDDHYSLQTEHHISLEGEPTKLRYELLAKQQARSQPENYGIFAAPCYSLHKRPVAPDLQGWLDLV